MTTKTDTSLVALAINAVNLGNRAAGARVAMLDAMQAAGFTADNISPKAGKNGSNIKSRRGEMLFLALQAISINGKRLDAKEAAEIAGDARAPRKIIRGTPCGNISGVTTWLGNATSWVSGVARDLAAREAAGEPKDGEPKGGSTWEAKALKTLVTWEERVQKLDGPAFDVPRVIETIRSLAKLLRA